MATPVTNPHAAQDAIIDRAIAASPEYQAAQRTGSAAKWDVTLPNGGVIHVSREAGPNGKINIANRTALQRALMIAPTFIPGAQGILSNIGSGTAQGVNAATQSGSQAAPAASTAAPGAAAIAPAATTATTASIWSRLAPTLLGVAGNVVGSVLNQRAAGKAADQQTAAAQQGIDLQKQVWGDIQRNQAPFIQTGQGAITRLNTLMGGSPLNLGQPSNAAPVAPNAQPLSLNPAESGGWTSMQPNSPIRPATGPQALVRVQAPDGEIRALPPDQAAMAVQKGAKAL